MNTWASVAREPTVVKRALKIAAVVGPVLVTINYLDVIIAGDFEPRMIGKMLLNFLVPYSVSTISSVAAIVENRDRENSKHN